MTRIAIIGAGLAGLTLARQLKDKADITVFDADRIIDRSEYTDPHHYSEGVVHVWVGGTAVLRAAEMTGARPGRFLERGLR